MRYRPKLLDLYCGAGGCSKGYHDAGFDVTGIDISPQPHYPFEFHLSDAIEYATAHGHEFDAIHASPPCQHHTFAAIQWRKSGRVYPQLILPTREMLKRIGKPYVIENVPGSPLENPIILNGAFFGLRVKRDRLFETSFPMPLIGLPKEIYQKMGRPFDARKPGSFYPVGHFSGVSVAREVMGIDWMTGKELSQAIPPAYTRFIGKYLMEYLWAQSLCGNPWDLSSRETLLFVFWSRGASLRAAGVQPPRSKDKQYG